MLENDVFNLLDCSYCFIGDLTQNGLGIVQSALEKLLEKGQIEHDAQA